MPRMPLWSYWETQLSTQVPTNKCSIPHLNCGFPGHLVELAGNVILWSSRVSNVVVELVVEGIGKLLFNCLDQSLTGDIQRVFDFVQENRLVFVRLVKCVYWHGLWQSCILLIISITWFWVLNRVGTRDRSVDSDVYEHSTAFFRRYQEWAGVQLRSDLTSFWHLSVVLACSVKRFRCFDLTSATAASENQLMNFCEFIAMCII